MAQVGIVLVSHSEKVASGIKDILEQAVGEVNVKAAGGMEGEIGTSLEKIQEALQNISTSEGALIFYDLGSAKMNAEAAIEMLELDNVHVVEAPILEGAYLAAVEASIGKSVQEILESIKKEFPEKG
ncbi:dihydroxyacetone kinase phosphoryl donor subunit DhaM [Thalassobacillus pellis]|uniref:dihydroxyacetone kinase phosphoryl donor subunit DhaM n=1 Tax=Thalassobacillus pellis TaxID=748008 RepID=UPI0019610BB2|nr:dihydroxyacetone kinase phosphoryl donor subunit DhaM [Thalassobacillus pellis]MBM7551626.1 dihydroxyacetone kinase phosphotransfer subunit [Thalassobacillus pellis]